MLCQEYRVPHELAKGRELAKEREFPAHMTFMVKRFPLAKKTSWDALLELQLFMYARERPSSRKMNVSG